MRTWNINSNVNLGWETVVRNILERKNDEEEIILPDVETKWFQNTTIIGIIEERQKSNPETEPDVLHVTHDTAYFLEVKM